MTRVGCHAGRDGDCVWSECPQKVEYRVWCPLDNVCPDCHGEESSPSCRCQGTGFIPLESVALRPLVDPSDSDEIGPEVTDEPV